MRTWVTRALVARRLPRGVPNALVKNPLADRLIRRYLRRRARPTEPRGMPPVH